MEPSDRQIARETCLLLYKSYGNFSTVFLQQKDLEKSMLYAKKSLHRYRKDGNERFIAGVLAHIGTTYYQMDSLQQASIYSNEALQLYRKSNHREEEAKVLQEMSLLSPSIRTRLKYQLEAQELWDQFNPKHFNSIINLGNIGGNYILLFRDDSIPGNAKQKKEYLDKAEYYLNKALEYCRTNKDQGTKRKCCITCQN